MKFSIVAAIRYLSDYELAPKEVLIIDCWGHEGYDLLVRLRDLMEGSTIWTENPKNHREPELGYLKNVENDQSRCLLELVAKQDLCLQFVGTYPCVDKDDNLQLFILPRKIAQDALRTAYGYANPVWPLEAIANPLHGANLANSNGKHSVATTETSTSGRKGRQ